MKAVWRLIWTLAIVGGVAFASRSASPGADLSAPSVKCELDPPHDLAGLEACAAQSPHDVELLLELGAALEAAGRAGDAAAAYRRAIAIDPGDAEAKRRLAR